MYNVPINRFRNSKRIFDWMVIAVFTLSTQRGNRCENRAHFIKKIIWFNKAYFCLCLGYCWTHSRSLTRPFKRNKWQGTYHKNGSLSETSTDRIDFVHIFICIYANMSEWCKFLQPLSLSPLIPRDPAHCRCEHVTLIMTTLMHKNETDQKYVLFVTFYIICCAVLYLTNSFWCIVLWQSFWQPQMAWQRHSRIF